MPGQTEGEPNMKSIRKIFKIGTHDGVFHCDEAFACWMLRQLPQYKDSEIIRTRDESVLETCDIVVDVGGVYDHSKRRYDHHQRSFQETMSSLQPGKPWTIRLSSAGLVYHHYGWDVLRQLLGLSFPESDMEPIYSSIYESFVQEIDAIDNGVPICDTEPRYKINTNLSSRVGHLNAPWNASEEDGDAYERFSKAMAVIGSEFQDRVSYAASAWWPARSFVLEAIESRFQLHKSGKIMELKKSCPWKEHYFDLMKQLKLDPQSINFVLFTDPKGKWRVQGVPEDLGRFTGKIFLHPDWRGVRDEELSKKTGIDGCIFVHASGFIGGNETKEGALQMAVKSIEFSP